MTSRLSVKPLSFYDYLLQKNLTEHEVCSWRGIPPGLYRDLPPISKLPRFSVQLEPNLEDVLYGPTRVQRLFHGTTAENCLLEGPRGTGKSLGIRFDGHMFCRAVPGWKYLVLRRKLTDLKKNHLLFMDAEMKKLGGHFNKTDNIAYYPNGSVGFFSYCEHISDLSNLLSSEFGSIYFDEMTTFPWDWIVKIASCARLPEDFGLTARVKGGTNPLGLGAAEVKRYYITKSVQPEEDPEYRPENYEAIRTKPEDNPHLDWEKYRRRLGANSEKIRRAWLDGEWVTEGAYFIEWKPAKEGRDWHVIEELPTVRGQSILSQPWIRIYRSFDWGFRPDPAVCHWIAVMPRGNAIFFKERSWKETVAKDVAAAIKRESEGMHVIDTFADPSMFAKRGEATFSIADIFESNGIPLTPSVNDRTKFGTAICDWLNTIIEEHGPGEDDSLVASYPKLQVLAPQGRLGCPNLIRTFPDILSDARDASRIADGGEDHYIVSCAYFCMGDAPPSRDPEKPTTPRWMLPKRAFMRSFPSRL